MRTAMSLTEAMVALVLQVAVAAHGALAGCHTDMDCSLVCMYLVDRVRVARTHLFSLFLVPRAIIFFYKLRSCAKQYYET